MGKRIGKNKYIVYWKIGSYVNAWQEYRSFRDAVAAYRRMKRNGTECGLAQVVADDGEEI